MILSPSKPGVHRTVTEFTQTPKLRLLLNKCRLGWKIYQISTMGSLNKCQETPNMAISYPKPGCLPQDYANQLIDFMDYKKFVHLLTDE